MREHNLLPEPLCFATNATDAANAANVAKDWQRWHPILSRD